MHAANDDRVLRLGGVEGALYRVPVPPTKRLRLRAQSAKTIEPIASVTGTTRNRAGRRTRLPITSKPPPAVEQLNLPSTPQTRQGLRTSRVRRLARTRKRAQPRRVERTGKGAPSRSSLPLRTRSTLKRLRVIAACAQAPVRARQRSHRAVQGHDLDLIRPGVESAFWPSLERWPAEAEVPRRLPYQLSRARPSGRGMAE